MNLNQQSTTSTRVYTHIHSIVTIASTINNNTHIKQPHLPSPAQSSLYQEGSIYWKAPPPKVGWGGTLFVWCAKRPMWPEVFWCVLLLLADRALVELELEAKDMSEGNLLELSILICSCTLLTHTDTISSFLLSFSTRNECCCGNHAP